MPNPYPARIAQPDAITPVFYIGLVNSGFAPPPTGFAAVDPVYGVTNAFFNEDTNDGTQYVSVSEDGSGNIVGISTGGVSIAGWEVFYVGTYIQGTSFGYVTVACDGEAFGLQSVPELASGLQTFQTIRMPYAEYDSNIVTEMGSSLIPREDVIDWGNDPSSTKNIVYYRGSLAPKTAGGLPQAIFPRKRRAFSDPAGFNNRLLGLLAGPFETTAVTIAETTDPTYNAFATDNICCIAPAPHNAIYSGMLAKIAITSSWNDPGSSPELVYGQFKTTPLYSSPGVPGAADSQLYTPYLEIDGINVLASDLADLGQWRSLGDSFIALDINSGANLSEKSWYLVNRDWTAYQKIRVYGLDADTCAIFTENQNNLYDTLQKDSSGNWFIYGYVTATDEDIILKEGIPDPVNPFVCPSSTSPPSGYDPSNAGTPGESNIIPPGSPFRRSTHLILGISVIPNIVLDPTDPSLELINLSCEGISTTDIELIFINSVGATDHQYRINGGEPTLVPTNKILTDMDPETEYTIEVRAISLIGEGPWSNPVKVKTWKPV